MKEPFEILIVEDYEPDVQFALRLFRKNRIANKLHVVRDGAEALDFLFSRGIWRHRTASQRPLVVLMDIRLPKLDGWEVLRLLRQDLSTRAIPVIMISGSLFKAETEQCRELGANGSLSKPLQMEELKAVLAQFEAVWAMVGQEEIDRAFS